MGRNIASHDTNQEIALPLLVAGIAASVAVFITLCASHQRKSSGPKSKSSSPKSRSTSPPSDSSHKSVKQTRTSSEDIRTSSSLPPPPPLAEVQEESRTPPFGEKEEVVLNIATHGPIGPVAPISAPPPRRKLSVSLSMKIPNGLSKIRTNKKEKQTEESVWMKTIILGERCRVPSGDDDDDEVVLYDDKGNRQRNYHPRTPRSLPVSRTNSFAGVEVTA